MSLERYVELSAALIGVDEATRDETLAALGSSPREWKALEKKWQSRWMYDPKLSKRYDELMLQRLRSACAGAPSLSFDDYIELAALSSAGQDTKPLLDELGLDDRSFYFRGYEWKARFSEDPRLGAYFRIKLMLQTAAHGKERRELAHPAPAKIVWANKCPECGAHKVTEPRTAYIYCDYCSTLFDLDWNRVRHDIFGLDPQVAFNAIVDGVRTELRAAREADDWDEYREAWRWVYGVDIELMPDGWSPRVAERGYRDAIIDFSVESCVVQNRDEEMQGVEKRHQRALEKSGNRSKREPLLSYWKVVVDCTEARARIYERTGVLARHPDALTAERFVRVNLAIFLGPLLEAASPEARDALLDASGFRRQAIEIPPATLHRSSCGRCGGQLLVAEGAKRTLCEQCGEVFDTERPRFECPGCGASVLFAATEDLCCAYCSTRFTIRR